MTEFCECLKQSCKATALESQFLNANALAIVSLLDALAAFVWQVLPSPFNQFGENLSLSLNDHFLHKL